MLKRIARILVSIFALMIAAPDSSAFGGFAFAASAPSKSKSKPQNQATQENADALSAFVASPIFTRVADTVESTVQAGPVFPLRGGLLCQRMTQTVKIDGQNVHASALMCRHPNGVWKIAVPPDMQDAAAAKGAPAGPPKPDSKKGSVPRPSPTGSPIAKAG
jgi:hypothetical protein